MRIVQSTWFPDPANIAGRWIDVKFALFNLALSYHTLEKIYPEVILYTDETGYKLLVEQLGLGYNEVFVNLANPLENIDNTICLDTYWVLRKLYTYSIQEKPFIHVDNDVYLFKAFDSKLTEATLWAQNIETNIYYTETLITIQNKFIYVPNWLKAISEKNCCAVNAGILGGEDCAFFKNLYNEVIAFIQRNNDCLHLVSVDDMNIFLEQCMFKCYADYLNLACAYHFDYIYTADMSYNAYKLHDTPTLTNYIHVMNCKSNDTVCEAVAKTLYYENQDLYFKCIEISELYQSREKIFINKPKRSEIEKNEEISIYFYRTKMISEIINENIPLNFTSINSLIKSIEWAKILINSRLINILSDVFYFEYMRYEFVISLNKLGIKNVYNHLIESKEKMDSFRFIDYKLALSNNIKLIISKWLWVQRNEFDSTRNNGFEENILQDPGYFQSIIYYYPEQQKIKEQQLDSINSGIIDYATQDISIGEIIKQLKKAMLYEKGITVTETVLESRIRFLVYQGVFHLEPVEEIFHTQE